MKENEKTELEEEISEKVKKGKTKHFFLQFIRDKKGTENKLVVHCAKENIMISTNKITREGRERNF